MTDSAVATDATSGRAGSSRDAEVLQNYVGGRWVETRAREFLDVYNPARGEVIARTPLSTARRRGRGGPPRRRRFPPGATRRRSSRARSLFRFTPASRGALRGARAHGHDRARQDARRVARERAPWHRVRRGRVRVAVADDGLRPGEHLLRHRLPGHPAAGRRLRRDRAVQLPRDGSAVVPSLAVGTGNTIIVKPSSRCRSRSS